MTAAAAFNGGKTQVNLNFPQIGGDYPYINCLKNAADFTLIDNSGNPSPDSLDSNGYPLNGSAAMVTHGGIYLKFFIPSQTAKPTNYTIDWSGTGTIFLSAGSFTTISGDASHSPWVISTTAIQILLGITTTGAGAAQVTNLRFYANADAADLAAGFVFQRQGTSSLIGRLKQANFGVIRFLNSQNANANNTSQWGYRKPVSYISWAIDEYRPGIYAGVASLTGAAYNAGNTPNGFTLADKATVIIKAPASVSGSTTATLNINSTGAKRIYDRNCIVDATGAANPGVVLIANRIYTFVYDAVMDCFIAGDQNGIGNFIPVEILAQMAWEVGAHPYFVTPVYAAENNSDYWPSGLATWLQANQPAWSVPRIEGPNEVWNFASVNQIYFANAKQYAINGNSTPLAATAFTYPSALGGSTKADVTLVSQPFAAGAHIAVLGFNAHGMSNVDLTNGYVTAINVGGNPNRITINGMGNAGGVSGTYTGSGGTIGSSTGDRDNWYGSAMAQIGVAFNAVFGGTPSTQTAYQVLCAVQTGFGEGGDASFDPRMTSPTWVLQGGTAAKNWVTHVTCANYTHSSSYGTMQEVTWAYSYCVTNAGNSTTQAALVASYVDGLGGANSIPYGPNLARAKNWYTNWKAWAQGFGINKMNFYEGGYDPVYTAVLPVNIAGIFDGAISTVSGATKANPCVLTLVTTYTNEALNNANSNFIWSGNPAVVGMMLDLFSIGGMTQLNCSTGVATFTGGASPNITLGTAPFPIVGQLINFGINNGVGNNVAAPSPLTTGQYVYVTSSSGGVIQVSATKGGTALTFAGSPPTCSYATGWKVTATGVGGNPNSIAIDVDSTGFTTWTAGGTQVAYYDQTDLYVMIFRNASKYCAASSNWANGLQGALTQNYTDIASLTGGGFTAEFPSCFMMTGTGAIGTGPGYDSDAWSVLNDIYETPDPPQWLAIVAFNFVQTVIGGLLKLRARFG